MTSSKIALVLILCMANNALALSEGEAAKTNAVVCAMNLNSSGKLNLAEEKRNAEIDQEANALVNDFVDAINSRSVSDLQKATLEAVISRIKTAAESEKLYVLSGLKVKDLDRIADEGAGELRKQLKDFNRTAKEVQGELNPGVLNRAWALVKSVKERAKPSAIEENLDTGVKIIAGSVERLDESIKQLRASIQEQWSGVDSLRREISIGRKFAEGLEKVASQLPPESPYARYIFNEVVPDIMAEVIANEQVIKSCIRQAEVYQESQQNYTQVAKNADTTIRTVPRIIRTDLAQLKINHDTKQLVTLNQQFRAIQQASAEAAASSSLSTTQRLIELEKSGYNDPISTKKIAGILAKTAKLKGDYGPTRRALLAKQIAVNEKQIEAGVQKVNYRATFTGNLLSNVDEDVRLLAAGSEPLDTQFVDVEPVAEPVLARVNNQAPKAQAAAPRPK
jgi:hypothetical protein